MPSIDGQPTPITLPPISHPQVLATPKNGAGGGARHLVGALNTRKIGTKHRIRLKKATQGGFGIKIAERDNMFGTNKPIYITAITTTGSAYADGRLKEGDMLLEINGVDLTGKSQPEVTRMLKNVPVEDHVEFLVSRQDNLPPELQEVNVIAQETNSTKQEAPIDCDNDTSLIDLDAPDHEDNGIFIDKQQLNNDHQDDSSNPEDSTHINRPGIYTYDIPINDTKSAGLGLYLKYPTLNGKDLGIRIENVITGGAAWKDGRLQPNDQILAINGIGLIGLSNSDASETLTAAVCRGVGPEATPNTIRLKIQRRDPSVASRILTETNTRTENSNISTQNGQNNISSHSLDNLDLESIDDRLGEERFQRDGFGRQSISEKRHAQLMANTDTIKRNQKAREERELQRQIERLEQQRLDDGLTINNHQATDLISHSKPIVGREFDVKLNNNHHENHHQTIQVNHRPPPPNHQFYDHNITSNHQIQQPIPPITQHTYGQLNGPIGHVLAQRPVQFVPYSNQGYEEINSHQLNYLDIVQPAQHSMMLDKPIAPMHGTLRVAHNRRINDGFRSTVVDKSQDGSNVTSAQINPLLRPVYPVNIHQSHQSMPVMSHPHHNQLNESNGLMLAQHSQHYVPCHPQQGYKNINLNPPNCLENVQPMYHGMMHEEVIVPAMTTHGTTRLARNRKLNESFRSAVDRSYDGGNISLHHRNSSYHQVYPVNNNSHQSMPPVAHSNSAHLSGPIGHVLAQRPQHFVPYNPQQGYESLAMNQANYTAGGQPLQNGMMHENVIIPMHGTVRVPRHRKMDESYLAVVDRPHDTANMRLPIQHSYNNDPQHPRFNTGSKFTSSTANLTTSKSNDQRISMSKGHETNKATSVPGAHKESSSLLSKFLKFGSMKKVRKDKSKR